jgi:transposase
MSMGKRLHLRELSEPERQALERTARSRTAPARQVERARVVLAAASGVGVGAVAERFQLSLGTVYLWWHRFEERGLAGLQDKPRGGRPPTYTREEVGVVVQTALTDPQTLGQSFASWTLDRLAAYLAEEKGIAMKRSRIDELLIAEGLRWRKEETWLGERVDPAFAENRGPSSDSTRLLQQEASSSASTRWVRKRRRASRAKPSST